MRTARKTIKTSFRNAGVRLERKFASWIGDVEQLDRVELNPRVNGAVSTEVYEVDVLGHRAAQGQGFSFCTRWLTLGFLPGMFIETLSTGRSPSTWWLLAPLGGLLLRVVGNPRPEMNIWAECKDMKDGVGRAEIAILKHSVDDVRRKRSGWKPTHVYIVTSSRFEPNAVRLATAYGFECFREAANGFEKVDPPIT